ncbi:hypothetical protein UY3_00472, partial [Chelonia mydas]
NLVFFRSVFGILPLFIVLLPVNSSTCVMENTAVIREKYENILSHDIDLLENMSEEYRDRCCRNKRHENPSAIFCNDTQKALLSRCDFNTWDSLLKFKDSMPQETKWEFSSLVEEGKFVARASLQVALDAEDSETRSMASTMVMCRGSWLQVSGLPHEVP